MINTRLYQKRTLCYFILSILLFSVIFIGAASAQNYENPQSSILLSINDGYLYD